MGIQNTCIYYSNFPRFPVYFYYWTLTICQKLWYVLCIRYFKLIPTWPYSLGYFITKIIIIRIIGKIGPDFRPWPYPTSILLRCNTFAWKYYSWADKLLTCWWHGRVWKFFQEPLMQNQHGTWQDINLSFKRKKPQIQKNVVWLGNPLKCDRATRSAWENSQKAQRTGEWLNAQGPSPYWPWGPIQAL